MKQNVQVLENVEHKNWWKKKSSSVAVLAIVEVSGDGIFINSEV